MKFLLNNRQFFVVFFSHLSNDGDEVVFTQTEELDVFHNHHLIVVLVENCVVQNV